MSLITDLEVVNPQGQDGTGNTKQPDVDMFLCHLPFGSAVTAYAVMNNDLESPLFRNALRLLREEIALKSASITEEVANSIRRALLGRGLDETRLGILSSIIGYLLGQAKAFIELLDLLQGEEIVTEQYVGEVKALYCA